MMRTLASLFHLIGFVNHQNVEYLHNPSSSSSYTTTIIGDHHHVLRCAQSTSMSNTELNVPNVQQLLDSTNTFQFFLRFSPLIGGPNFLPIHVELMCFQNHMVQTPLNNNNNDDLSSFNNICYLHRIDFIPQNPNDENTIKRLLSLQSVPSMVRYRILYYSDNEQQQQHDEKESKSTITATLFGEEYYEDCVKTSLSRILTLLDGRVDTEFHTTTERKSMITIPLGTKRCIIQNENVQSFIDLRLKLKEIVTPNIGKELHLITYNCFTFTYDIWKNLI